MGMGLTANQLGQLQRFYLDTIVVQQYQGKKNGSDYWVELGYCSGRVTEKTSIAFKGTSQAMASDATVDIIKAPAILTSRNDKFRLICAIMPSDVELAVTLDPQADPQPITAKRTISLEVQDAKVIKDFGNTDVIISCKCVFAKRP